jgi:hypothetical protein
MILPQQVSAIHRLGNGDSVHGQIYPSAPQPLLGLRCPPGTVRCAGNGANWHLGDCCPPGTTCSREANGTPYCRLNPPVVSNLTGLPPPLANIVTGYVYG